MSINPSTNFFENVQVDESLFCKIINNNLTIFLYQLLLIILIFWTIYIIIKRKRLINFYKNLKLFYKNLFLMIFIISILIFWDIYFWLPNLIVFYFLLIPSYIILSYIFNRKNKKENKFYIIWFLIFTLILPFLYLKYDNCYYSSSVILKPIIYLYPQEKQEVKVELELEWKLIADYPKYDEKIKGWEVTAYPDSTIIEDEKEYSYLFWEAQFKNNDWDLSKWFIVEWKDAREFLQEKLSYIWLTPKEYNEFIVYWYPKMMNNKYNLVYFAWLDYTSKAPLNITPKPDSMLRVFTVIKPLEEKIDIQEQVLEKFDKKWFSVVEWWGTILE